jgi:ribosome-associated toxin RatA of RatAB toxin-antitoxin module
MKSYSETNIFTRDETALLASVTAAVAKLPNRMRVVVRCHELARAVGTLYGLEVADGHYGYVEHSWLWTKPLPEGMSTVNFRMGFPNILDVYSVGQLPMVKLVASSYSQLPHLGWAYRSGTPRCDIDQKIVEQLIREMIPVRKVRW